MSTEFVLSVQGMHCASCGLLIDETLEDLPGVDGSSTSVRAATTTVRVDPEACDPGTLIAEIAMLGYTAELAQP